MDIQSILENMKTLQKSILDYIDDNRDIEENFQKIISILDKQKIRENQQELKEFLYLISNISKHHNRNDSFSNKIQQILKEIQNNIKQTFSNSEIFEIFTKNKDILLFLLKEKIIIPEQSILKIMKSAKFKPFRYIQFFRDYLNTDNQIEVKNSDDFEEKRKNGENDNYICQLIRTDSIDQFISYFNQQNLSFSTEIEESIYETNLFLMKNKATLIEYAAFFGSTQIFKFLFLNGAKTTPFLWNYAIHGNNPELITFMIEEKFQLSDNSFYDCIIESIKCHHIEMTNYFIDNLYRKRKDDDSSFEIQSLKSHNYSFFQIGSNDKQLFYNLCEYNFPSLVSILLKTKRISINTKIIFKIFFYLQNFINFYGLIQF